MPSWQTKKPEGVEPYGFTAKELGQRIQ
jgi:hypothetical protein